MRKVSTPRCEVRGVLETVAGADYGSPCELAILSYPLSRPSYNVWLEGEIGTRRVGETGPAPASPIRCVPPRATATRSLSSSSPTSAALNAELVRLNATSTGSPVLMLPTTSGYSNGGCGTNHLTMCPNPVKDKAKVPSLLRGNASMSKAAEGGTRNHGRYRNQIILRDQTRMVPSWVKPFHTLKDSNE